MKKVTIGVICREDPRLPGTVNSLRDTAGDQADILVLYDGEQKRPQLPEDIRTITPWESPKGTSAMRHAVVSNSDTPLVISCDSHLEFPQGWLDKYIDELESHPNSVVCPICDCVDPETLESHPHYAANLHWMADHDPHTGTNRHAGERVAVTGRWRKHPDIEPGPVGCIMGACYGVNRAWYNHIGEPWKYGYGWGSDEESITLASSFCGGQSRMVDTRIRHMTQKNITYMPSRDHTTAVWYNRLRLIWGYPHSEEYARELEDWVYSSSAFQGTCGKYLKKGIDQIRRRMQPDRLRDHLKKEMEL